ncbi:unnamed protein product [Boreogadus saida]
MPPVPSPLPVRDQYKKKMTMQQKITSHWEPPLWRRLPGTPSAFSTEHGGDRERADRPLEGPLPPDDFLRFCLFYFSSSNSKKKSEDDTTLYLRIPGVLLFL